MSAETIQFVEPALQESGPEAAWANEIADLPLNEIGDLAADSHDEGNRERYQFLLNAVWQSLDASGVDVRSQSYQVSERLSVRRYNPYGSVDKKY